MVFKDNPSPNAPIGEKCLTDDMNVRNPDELINKAFEILGVEKTGKVNWGNKEGQKPGWTIIRGKTALGNDHFKFGDSEGNEEYDPYSPDLPIIQTDIYKVYIEDEVENCEN